MIKSTRQARRAREAAENRKSRAEFFAEKPLPEHKYWITYTDGTEGTVSAASVTADKSGTLHVKVGTVRNVWDYEIGYAPHYEYRTIMLVGPEAYRTVVLVD